MIYNPTTQLTRIFAQEKISDNNSLKFILLALFLVHFQKESYSHPFLRVLLQRPLMNRQFPPVVSVLIHPSDLPAVEPLQLDLPKKEND